MNLLDLYYQIKPLIPRRFQLALRRRMVLRKLPRVRHIWPIDERAGKKPEGWPGWPDGKQFAFVLTHDVETREGLEKVLPLARLEQKLGFRSCFNFVGRDYPVYDQVRKALTDMGFEVGVHGLTHKGNLFRSRKVFEKQRPEINKILKEWKAVGFRAPTMFHHLEWTAELDIEYDSSTFDTDPFEPQPDGVGTIFPFWVPATHNLNSATRNPQPATRNQKPGICNSQPATVVRSSILDPRSYELTATSPEQLATRNPQPVTGLSPGYVELPYTLPQDHIVFTLLRERDTRIWKEKLDWIARQGGMALMLVHPDYISFESAESINSKYPLRLYEELLDHIMKQYQNRYWMALPKEVSRFYRKHFR